VVDVNPADTISRHTPRQTDLVDAVAAAARIADQQMRSNPMEDATVVRGLTRFRGNYGVNFAWFGEFSPADQNLTDEFGNEMPQRGVVFQRDDPQGNIAFAMYDWDPQAGVPLRQKIVMHDADGKVMLQEGRNGGRAFPDTPIVMYQRETIDPSGITLGSDTTVWSGDGNLTGTRIDFRAAWAAAGTVTVSSYLRISGGGVTINTATVVQSGAQNFFYDVDIEAIFDVADFVQIEWHAWRSAGTGSFYPRIYRCRTYSF
jgi:hypothetical protein